MTLNTIVLALGITCGLTIVVGCGTADRGGICTPGTSSACTCTDGRSGAQACGSDPAIGAFLGPCVCTGVLPDAGAGYCGDYVCDGSETCASCDGDCGPCSYCGDSFCDSGESCSTCSTDCGACACTVAVGGDCMSDSDCCPGPGYSAYCTTDGGTRTICRAGCASGSDCASGCCVARTNGIQVCAPATACAATCDTGAYTDCVPTSVCCALPDSARPTSCTTYASGQSCMPFCSSDADCASLGVAGWTCTLRDDGTSVCLP